MLALDIRTIEPFVIRQRMGIWPDHMQVHKRWAAAGTAVVHCTAQRGIARDRVRPVHFVKMEIGEAPDQTRDVPPWCLHFDRNGNCVFVVLDAKEDRQLAVGRRVQRLPELTFTGCAISERNVGDLGDGTTSEGEFWEAL